MKNILLVSVFGLGLISTAWATDTVNIHERVNNAQAPAHQIQSASVPSAIQGSALQTDEHEKAAIAHETMKNGQSGPHQAMAEAHRRMIKAS
ncbi:hypothetical protein GA0061070_10652 [Kosakonia oryziphila]|uniref:Silver-binding protein SilE n=1 Tax=Kosakonia oryziphila TaxID=1005667 RepID=A0A1C4GFX5_9ENTR|nr:hypothetical protein [Kosakonia oryziphila]SCC66843.1 hypothetical protein GA0061070_10652 [Kosakonia oryziphila]